MNKGKLCILSVDKEKVFNMVVHQYLFKAVRASDSEVQIAIF